MNVELINAFVRATKDVFEKTAKVPALVAKPRLRDENEQASRVYKVSVTIALSGSVEGTVWISFAEKAVAKLDKNHIAVLNGDFAASGLLDMGKEIIAEVNKIISTDTLAMAEPQLIMTNKLVYPGGSPVIVLQFDTSLGRFLVEMAMSRRVEAAKPVSELHKVA